MLKRPIIQIKQIAEVTPKVPPLLQDTKTTASKGYNRSPNKYGPKITPSVHNCVIQAIADAKDPV